MSTVGTSMRSLATFVAVMGYAVQAQNDVIFRDNALALAHLSHAYTEARDADQATKVLDKLLERYPNDGQAYADLGKAWTLKGETARAIEAYERALLNDKTQGSLHYRLDQLYEKIGKTALAQRHLAAFKAGEARKRKKYKKAARGSDQ